VLRTEPVGNVLVFSRTKYRADRIGRKLDQQGFRTTVLHSNRTQGQRERALAGFKSGAFQIMVATDIAARGIDVDSISHVINYDTPPLGEDYIHRIGRTGRAETTGDAITFVASEERGNLRQIERHTGKRLVVKTFSDFEVRADADAPRRERMARTSGRSHKTTTGRVYAKKPSRRGDARRW
jgi:ATP-dependent RNA helicase RhlE